MLEFLEGGFKSVIDKLGTVTDAITNALSDMLISLVDNIKDVPVKIKSALLDVRDTLKSVLNLIVSGISNLSDTIITWFTDLISNVKSLPGTIKSLFLDLLKFLFIPSENNLTKSKDVINSKFSFVSFFSDKITTFLKHDVSNTDNFSMTVYGVDFNLFNWSWIDLKVINSVRFFLSGILYLFTFFKIIKFAPKLIKEGRISQ